jgi:hypothetical protein
LTPTLVPPEDLNRAWLAVLPYVRRLIEEISGGRMTELSLYRDISEGGSQLWVVFDENDDNKLVAFVITRLVQYEKIKMVCIDHLAGDKLFEWMQPMYELIERWAREVAEADGVEVLGRPGWERAFEKIGYPFKKRFTLIERIF